MRESAAEVEVVAAGDTTEAFAGARPLYVGFTTEIWSAGDGDVIALGCSSPVADVTDLTGTLTNGFISMPVSASSPCGVPG